MDTAHTGLKVELLVHTGGEKNAALAAKLCYSDASIDDLLQKVTDTEQDNFLSALKKMGHLSVFEHLSFTFGIEGVSRTLTHQLVRHRIASYSQKSQRYVKHKGGFEFIIPPSVRDKEEATELFESLMQKIADVYDRLSEFGIEAEDARYVLPNACETKIIVTMNARELLHFFRLRCCERAQWEIRDMAFEMLKKVFPVAPTVFSEAGPSCVSGACSEGKMSCCKVQEVRAKFRALKA